MPTPDRLEPLEIRFNRGFWPSAPDIPPIDFIGTIRAGSNCWLRSTGRPEVAKGLLERSATNVGARIFAANLERASIAGGLVGDRLPHSGLIRYDNFCLLFLSEETDAPLYLDEVDSGVTTSPTAGRLRVAVPDGLGGFDAFDAGFDKPLLPSAEVTVFSFGNTVPLPMTGFIGVAIAPWRSKTDAIGPPSDIVYTDVTAAQPGLNERLINIDFPAAVSGQDGWVYLGTRWGDQSGELRVVRYVYLQPRGTVAAAALSPNITGTGTLWTRDLRPGDTIALGGAGGRILEVTSDTTAVLENDFSGTPGSGLIMTIATASASWFDADLGALVSRDTFRPPRAAGVVQYAGRVILFGVPDTTGEQSDDAVGNSLVPMLFNNPEHCDLTAALRSDSGSDIINALPTDGPLYLMTTTGLELVSFTSDPDEPYKIKQIAAPGFKSPKNGILVDDYFYGFNEMPFRTKASKNIDSEFAEPVREIMKDWDGRRVTLADDPTNRAVLYIYDDGASSVVIPFMTQLSSPGNPVWGAPLNFADRIIDNAVVDGELSVTYLSGGNFRAQKWEGGAGIGGDRYVATQFYDPRLLADNKVRRLLFAGKAGSLSVYAARAGSVVPDVSDLGAATATFDLSDVDVLEPQIKTKIPGRAFAFRVNFDSDDGNIDKLVASGTPLGR